MYSLPWIRLLFHRLHGAQQKTLSFVVDALLVVQDVRLAEIAREAAKQNNGKVRYTLKRLWRFLRNPRINDDTIIQGLAEWVWPHFHSWKYIPISIDWTHNEKRAKWATLAAFVTINGRGIPLMMWSFRKAEYDEHLSRNRCEEAFIKHLISILLEDSRIVIIADREQQSRQNPDPWLLATSLSCRANTVTKLYARRMIIEEDFREAKSRLDWGDSRIRTLHHYRRLTTVIMIVLSFAMFVGRIAHRRPTLAEQVARRRVSPNSASR